MSSEGRRSWGISLALAAAFFAAHCARMPFHEMWRDEWHSWLIAVGSSSPLELAANTRYDGHPLLWPLLVWAVSRLAATYVAMQVLHAAIAAAAALVVLHWAPWPRWSSILFLVGYFPFFEYAMISRGYGLSMGLTAACCALLCAERLRPVVLGCALGALAWSTFYGALLALAFLAVLAVEALSRPRLPGTRAASRRPLAAAWMLGAAGTALAILDAVPPREGGGYSPQMALGWDTARVLRAGAAFFRGLVPVPTRGVAFWNTNFLDGQPALAAALAAGLMVAAWLLLRPGTRARLLWVLMVAAVAGFTYATFWGGLRHHGFFVLALVASAWFSTAGAAGSPDERGAWRGWLVVPLLAVHAAVAAYATLIDLQQPFSASPSVVRWLHDSGLEQHPIVGERDTRVSPLAALLGRPVHYVRGRRWGTFVIFDRARAGAPGLADIEASVREVEAERGREAVIVLSGPPPAIPVPAGFEQRASFTRAIVPTETYLVYTRTPPAIRAPAGDE